MTPEQLAALRAELEQVMQRYRRVGAGNPSAKRVSVYLCPLPVEPPPTLTHAARRFRRTGRARDQCWTKTATVRAGTVTVPVDVAHRGALDDRVAALRLDRRERVRPAGQPGDDLRRRLVGGVDDDEDPVECLVDVLARRCRPCRRSS